MRFPAVLRLRSHLAAPVVAAGVAVLLVGCSLLVDFDKEQCQTTQDCVARGPGFASAVCVDSACVTGQPGTGGQGGSPGACSKNSECSANDNAVCRKGACVPLLNQYCSTLYPPDGPITDDAFIVGFLNPFTGPLKFLGPLNLDALKLAQHEFKESQQGLKFAGNDVRPIVVVGCNEIDDIIEEDGPSIHDAIAAVQHFAELEVPFVIGPNATENAVIIKEEAVKNQIMFLSANADGVALTANDDDSLLWSTYPNIIDELDAVPPLLEQVEAKVRQDLGLGSNCTAANAGKDNADCVKVAFMYREDADGVTVQAKINELIRPNGLAAADNGDAFLPLGYKEEQVANAVFATLDLEPHIIILVGHQDAIDITLDVAFMPAVEDGWTKLEYRPNYIGTRAIMLPELPATILKYTTTNEYDLRHRIRGVNGIIPVVEPQAMKAYRLAHNGFLKKAPGFFTEHYYDAFYTGVFAVAAASNAAALNGSEVAARMRFGNHEELQSTVDVGANDLQVANGYAALEQPFNLEGASGHLHFDTTTGFTLLADQIPIWCLNKNFAMLPSKTQVFDVPSKQLVGEFDSCDDPGAGGGGSGGTGGSGGGGGAGGG